MKIDIGIYYGPIDLLVYLVRKKELDIFDIPIAQVAEEYLNYLKKIERNDLEDAADFLLMAAILIRLKIRSLLPRTQEDEEGVKPITLMQIIEEFKKYKELAKVFGEMEAETSRQFPRFSKLESTVILEKEDPANLFLAFRNLKPSEEAKLVMKRQEVPISMLIEDIKKILNENERLNFLQFLKEKNNVPLAVGYFFGMLEVVKEGLVGVEQDEPFGEIYLYRKNEQIFDSGSSSNPNEKNSQKRER